MARFFAEAALALVLIGASYVAPSAAHAELEPVFDQLLLYNSPATLPTMEVEAEGQDWTRVSTETLHVTTSYYVSLEKGDILTIAATPGPGISQIRSRAAANGAGASSTSSSRKTALMAAPS